MEIIRCFLVDFFYSFFLNPIWVVVSQGGLFRVDRKLYVSERNAIEGCVFASAINILIQSLYFFVLRQGCKDPSNFTTLMMG
ncbi:hypothetical protein RRG08_006840 [Elysia crispata]|uniref:Uncharacterized protein n=1 Tax=Elysia crispata TaxID=231223 RepID=A0AAE0XVK9_9GAST|nr:hypothetical protein RRG08_006840 [Elysia crispata]